MKETVSTMTLFKIIIVFTFLFAAFLSVAILYNKVYKLKNQTISIIEKYEGINSKVNNKTIRLINNYLKNSGYTLKGYCSPNEFGVPSLEVSSYEKVQSNKKYHYCLSVYCLDETNKYDKNCSAPSKVDKIFYKTKLFFKLDLPFFGELLTFKITGDTKEIIFYTDKQILS